MQLQIDEVVTREVAKGALADAGLSKDDVNGLFTAGVPEYQSGLSPLVIADYLGIDASYVDDRLRWFVVHRARRPRGQRDP